MKRRFVVVAIKPGGDIASDEIYGLWETERAAGVQAAIWQFEVDQLGEEVLHFMVKELHGRSGSALEMLWSWVREVIE